MSIHLTKERDRAALVKERRRVVMFAEECEAQHEENTREQDSLSQQRDECAALHKLRVEEEDDLRRQREESKALHEEIAREREELQTIRHECEMLRAACSAARLEAKTSGCVAVSEEGPEGEGGPEERGAGASSQPPAKAV